MPNLARFLGLAFAAADLLVEIDEAKRIVFALGSQAARDHDLVGRPLAKLFGPAERAKVERLLQGVRPGERRGPEIVEMTGPDGARRTARLSVFALPELQPHLSCALTWVAEAAAIEPTPPLRSEAFGDEVRRLLTSATSSGRELSLALVEIKGLIEARQNLPAADMATLLGHVHRLMARHGTSGATANLSPERFAIVHEHRKDLDDLVQALDGLSDPARAKLAVDSRTVALSPKRDPLHQFRAVRTALDTFLSAGLPKDEAALQKAFNAALDETTRSARRLGEILDERRFELFYQPVVDLATETAVHYEVLVRFERNTGPAPLIKLAEDLAMIEALDALVVEKAVGRLRAKGSERLELAVNVSGGTLTSDAFLERLLGATRSDAGLRKRLHLEITESAALLDLEAAARRIRALGDAGFQVAIDDFGAGAASFDYLRALPVSAVKIDGRYVRAIDRDERAQAIVKHLIGLCGELRYATVAEMIEQDAELGVVKSLGVDCGQGWLFGRAEPQPVPPVRRVQARARRMGERESWG